MAPARLTTSGVSQAISSAVGNEKPSYNDGTQASSAEPITSTSSASEMPASPMSRTRASQASTACLKASTASR